MIFLKKLFGATPEVPEEEQRAQEARDFDVLKYDGVAALRQNAYDYAIKCFDYALDMRDDAETRDYATFLRRLAALPSPPPLMIEHLKGAEEYAAAAAHIQAAGAAIGLAFAP